MDRFLLDLRFACRILWNRPGFAAIAVLALALGIGGNTAIFSIVNAALIQPLPYPDPDRLVLIWGDVMRAQRERRGASPPDFVDWRQQSRSFEGMAAWWTSGLTLFGSDGTVRISGELVSPEYFSLLGIQPVLGRTFTPRERLGETAPPVAILSHALWTSRFGGDPAVLGQTIALDRQLHTVVGVAPPGFRGLSDQADVFAPLSSFPSLREVDRGGRWFPVLARLKAGVTQAQAQEEMNRICADLEGAYPTTNEERGAEIASLTAETVGDIRPALLVLMAAAGFVLLIACANVAALLMAQAESRQHEMAVRAALGASTGRVLSQLITESLVLSSLGTGLGLLLSFWGVEALMALSPVQFPGFVQPRVDLVVASFAALLSLGTGILVGLAPALHSRARHFHGALRESAGRSSAGSVRQRFRNALAVLQVATVLVLLVGAGLFLRSFERLSALDPGFDPRNLLTLRINLPGDPPAADAQPGAGSDATPAAAGARRSDVTQLIAERSGSLPGVRSVALGSDMPLTGGGSAIFYTAEGQPPVTAQNVPRAYIHRVSTGFFSTLGIPMRQGRDFLNTESEGVAIVSENLAKRFWPGEDAIGRRIKPGREDSANPWWTIVGVVAEVRYRALPTNPTADPDIFLPFDRRASRFTLFLRGEGDPASLTAPLRAAIQDVYRSAALYDIAVMPERVSQQMARPRFTSWLTGVYSGVALLLAMLGIYGLMAYTVSRRTREIGIRMALGATRGQVMGQVLRRGTLLLAAGVAMGVGAALLLMGTLETLLYGVDHTDPLTYAGVIALISATALAAMLVPARRAAAIDPVEALRYE